MDQIAVKSRRSKCPIPAFVAIAAEMLYLRGKGISIRTVIANEAIQGMLLANSLDCFVASLLAKTAADQTLTTLGARINAMATPEENSKLVLAMYKHFHKKPDQVLFARDFQSYVVEKSLDVEDMKSGLAYGYEQKWFEDGPNGTIRLTQAGYDLLPPA